LIDWSQESNKSEPLFCVILCLGVKYLSFYKCTKYCCGSYIQVCARVRLHWFVGPAA